MPKYRRGNMVLEPDQRLIKTNKTANIIIITQNTTIYVKTTGDDDTGDGTETNPYASLNKALNYLTDKMIASDTTVTIDLGPGTYSDTTISLAHPNLSQIVISGDTTTPSNVTLAINDTYSIASIYSYNLRLLEGVKLTPGTGNTTGIIVAAATSLHVENIEIYGFDYGVQLGNGGNIWGESVEIDNCTYGIYAYVSGTAMITDPTLTNCTNTGAYAKNGSTLRFPGTITVSGNVANYDPSLNSVGNNNSIITDDD